MKMLQGCRFRVEVIIDEYMDIDYIIIGILDDYTTYDDQVCQVKYGLVVCDITKVVENNFESFIDGIDEKTEIDAICNYFDNDYMICRIEAQTHLRLHEKLMAEAMEHYRLYIESENEARKYR